MDTGRAQVRSEAFYRISLDDSFSSPGDYAICHLGFSSPLDYPFWTMLVSSMVIVIGYVSRAVRLHKTLSIKLFGKAKFYIKLWTRKVLRPIFSIGLVNMIICRA